MSSIEMMKYNRVIARHKGEGKDHVKVGDSEKGGRLQMHRSRGIFQISLHGR